MRRRRRLAGSAYDYERERHEDLTVRIETALDPEVNLFQKSLASIKTDAEYLTNSFDDYGDMAWELLFESSFVSLLQRVTKTAGNLARHAQSINKDYGRLYNQLADAEDAMDEAFEKQNRGDLEFMERG